MISTTRWNAAAFTRAGETFAIYPTLDYAIEWCENKLLANEKEQLTVDIGKSILTTLDRSFPSVTRVKEFMERVDIQAGEYFIWQGEASNDLFYIESRLATVKFETIKGEVVQLSSIKSGATIGEIVLYLGSVHSTSVKAEESSMIYRLSSENLRKMHKEDPALAPFCMSESLPPWQNVWQRTTS